jgi:hypothetical protein
MWGRWLALEGTMSVKIEPLGMVPPHRHARVFVANILYKEQYENVVFILAGRLVAARPEGGIEVGLLDWHVLFYFQIRIFARKAQIIGTTD